MKGSAGRAIAAKARAERENGRAATARQIQLLTKIAERTGRTFPVEITFAEADRLIQESRRKGKGSNRRPAKRQSVGTETKRENRRPMKAGERMQLTVLCKELDVPFDPTWTRKQARRMIDQLRARRERRFRKERDARRRERRRRA